MPWSQLRRRWDEVSAATLRQWPLLSARDIRVIAGDRDRLIGVLQQRYGQNRETVDRSVRAFTRRLTAAEAPTSAESA